MADPRRAIGQAAEEAAARWLRRAGLCVVERNVRFREGEIDLVIQVRDRAGSHVDRGAPRENDGEHLRVPCRPLMAIVTEAGITTIDAIKLDIEGAEDLALAPFLRALRPLVQDARPTIRDLSRLINSPGADNDLIDANKLLPRLQRVASPAFTSGRQALEKAQPVLEFARPYTPELVGWLRDFGQGASTYDANGHYARIQPIFNAYSFADNPTGGALTPIPPSQRLAGLQTGFVKRCPGAASQPAADGSAPWRDVDGSLDCDPSLVLPGP